MGRKAGGKNFGNFTEASTATTVEQELSAMYGKSRRKENAIGNFHLYS